MQTINDYLQIASQIRKIQIQAEPIPPHLQEIIEMFIPLESKFPNRTIIPIYEYPDSNPRLFLENKRGFRLFFVVVFISNKMAADFYQELSANGAVKYQVARFLIEVVDNIVFIRTRGQRLANMLSKLEKGIQTQPLCMFHYDLKDREILKIIDKGDWAFRVIWGPPIQVPLYGAVQKDERSLKLETKGEKKEAKYQTKMDFKYETNQIPLQGHSTQEESETKQQKQQQPIAATNLISKPTSYYISLGLKNAQALQLAEKDNNML